MPPRSLLRECVALCVIDGLVLSIVRIETAHAALASSRHVNPHLALLGAIEAIAPTHR